MPSRKCCVLLNEALPFIVRNLREIFRGLDFEPLALNISPTDKNRLRLARNPAVRSSSNGTSCLP